MRNGKTRARSRVELWRDKGKYTGWNRTRIEEEEREVMVIESGTVVELFRRREGGKVADGNSVRGREGRGEREEEKGEEENGEGLRVIYGRIQFPLRAV